MRNCPRNMSRRGNTDVRQCHGTYGELKRDVDMVYRMIPLGLKKKNIKWESSKCTVVCRTREELDSRNIKLYIEGGEISKSMSATYLPITMTSKGVVEEHNIKRGKNALKRTREIV